MTGSLRGSYPPREGLSFQDMGTEPRRYGLCKLISARLRWGRTDFTEGLPRPRRCGSPRCLQRCS